MTKTKFQAKFLAIPLIVVGGILGAACGQSGAKTTKSTATEAQTANEQLGQFLQNQPVPIFNYSQLRENVKDIETMQASGTVTTSFFFNQGVQDPILSCPSVGFAIPSEDQLTNPAKAIPAPNSQSAVVSQIEATGVYTGGSTGTYVICIDGNGAAYPFYWEGFVSTVGAPAVWDSAKHQVVLTGSPSVKFSQPKK